MLEKVFTKKNVIAKEKALRSTENIDNNVKGKNIPINNIGLYNYLTASNIRHKIKHPLFLSMRFPLGIHLYLRKLEFQILNEEDLIRKV